jgi:hypothetical protein
MRTIYLKRSALIILIATSSIISSVYLVDYYFYQNGFRSETLQSVSVFSEGFENASNGVASQFIMESKEPHMKCSVTIALILCEDDEYLTLIKPPKNSSLSQNKMHVKRPKHPAIPIAKDFSRQINQTLVLLKSIAIQTLFSTEIPTSMRDCVNVIILSDKKSHFDNILDTIKTEWSLEFQSTLNLTYAPVKYPKGSGWMKKMFRPCATLRLFIPELLTNNTSDSIIYVDTDFIFLRSLQSLMLKYFNPEKVDTKGKVLAGMAPCLFHYGTTVNKIPYYGTSGLNAGRLIIHINSFRSFHQLIIIKTLSSQ